jgi:xanthine dehydrogenase YagR molybdenum-binding subunit
VACAAQDFGNGVRTVLARSLAEPLGLRPSDVSVQLGNSDLPTGPHSSGSRTTASVVPGVLHGLERVLPRVQRAAERAFGVGRVSAAAPGGLVGLDPTDAGRIVPWSEILPRVPPQSAIGRRRPDPGGMYFPFAITGVNSGMLTTGSVQITEVEVDTRLGSTRVLRSWTGLGVGRRVAPELARSQVQGGVLMGLGYTLFEERRRDPNHGIVLTRGMEDYRVPTLADLPEIQIHFDDSPLGNARGGLAGLSELPVVALPASIGNAMHHALGVRFHDLPLRPWSVLEALS